MPSIDGGGCTLKEHTFFPKELKTLEAYAKNTQGWTKTHSDQDFWLPCYTLFQELLPKGKVLDIGCGGGRDAEFFIQAGYDYVGIDAVGEMIKQARDNAPSGNFLQMSMYSLGFLPHPNPNSFDGFWASASLLHIPKENLPLVLEEIKRVVRPGGIGFISVKEGEGESMVRGGSGIEGENERFFAFYEIREFAGVLESKGFEILKCLRFTRIPDSAVWLVYFVKV